MSMKTYKGIFALVLFYLHGVVFFLGLVLERSRFVLFRSKHFEV